MPYAIEASGDGGYGGEEGVGHPDGEGGVLLPDGLPCCDVVARGLADVAAYGELYPAAGEGDEGDAYEHGDAYIAVHDGACGDGNGYGECHGPEVEGGVARVLQALGKTWQGVAYGPCQQERTDEGGEYLADDEHRGGEEGLSLLRIDQRHDERNEQGRGQVDEQDVGDEVCGMASELGTYHGGSACCGADEAGHGTLNEQSAR